MKKFLALLILLGLCSAPGWAEDKGVIQLQQQVTLLMSQVQDLQKNFESDVSAIKSLVGENTDTVNKLAVTVGAIQESLTGQATVTGQRQDQLAQQFQSLTDTIGELQARLNNMEQMLKQVQTSQQTIATCPPPNEGMAPAGAVPTTGAAVPGPVGAPPVAPAATGTSGVPPAGAPPAAGGAVLPAQQLYQNALSDYLTGLYPVAQGELQQFIQTYPTDPQVADAMFFLGDVYYRQHNYDQAIAMFNNVINQYPDSQQTPGAELKKGFALLGKGDKQGCINELKNLIQKYPQSDEARQAKEQLNTMGGDTSGGTTSN